MAKAKRKAKATKAKTKKSKKKIIAKFSKRAKARKPQRFTVSHHREEDFDQACGPTRPIAISASRRRPAAWCRLTSSA